MEGTEIDPVALYCTLSTIAQALASAMGVLAAFALFRLTRLEMDIASAQEAIRASGLSVELNWPILRDTGLVAGLERFYESDESPCRAPKAAVFWRLVTALGAYLEGLAHEADRYRHRDGRRRRHLYRCPSFCAASGGFTVLVGGPRHGDRRPDGCRAVPRFLAGRRHRAAASIAQTLTKPKRFVTKPTPFGSMPRARAKGTFGRVARARVAG